MISNLSKLFTKKLIIKGNVNEEERELYEYGLFLLLSNIFFIFITIIVGSIVGVILQSLIFFVAFCTIRQYAGGYHATTELRCEISTISSIVLTICLIPLIDQSVLLVIIWGIATIFTVIIFIFAPIDTDTKVLTEEELKVFRKKTKIILVTIYALILISLLFKVSAICIPCCMSLILEGILLLAGKIKKTKRKTSVENT